SPLPVQVDHRAQDDLPQAVQSAAYFVAREALTNIVKHAGASSARISLSTQEHSGRRLLHLEVHDDGTGGAHTEEGRLLGLARLMAARDCIVHGSNPPSEPTVITTEIPYEYARLPPRVPAPRETASRDPAHREAVEHRPGR